MKKALLLFLLTAPLITWGQRPELMVPVGHSWGIIAVAFSPACPEGINCPFGDGKYALTGGGDGIAILWEVQSGKQIHTFEGHLNGVSSVAFSPVGPYILTGSWDGTAKLWDIQSGEEIRSFVRNSGPATPSGFSVNYSQRVTTVAFSPDGKYITTGVANDTTIQWDAQSGQQIRTFKGQTGALSPNEKFILTGSRDSTTIVREATSGKEIHLFKGNDAKITAVDFSPDGAFVLTGSSDNTAILWDAQSGRKIRSFTGHADAVFYMAFSPDRKYLLAFSVNANGDNQFTGSKATIWDAQSGKRVSTLILDEVAETIYPPIGLAFSADGKKILIGAQNNAALWDIQSGEKTHDFKGVRSAVTAVTLSADGQFALTGGKQGLILWDAQSGKKIRAFEGVPSAVISVAFSGDGRYALTGGMKDVILWDVQSGIAIRSFEEVPSAATSVAFSPNGQYALSGHTVSPEKKDEGPFNRRKTAPVLSNKAAILWDVESGKEIRAFKKDATRFTNVAFSPDGKFILADWADDTNQESPEYTAIVWDAQSGEQARSSSGFTGQVFRGAFSPDGQYLLTGKWTSTVKLWDFRKGVEIASLNSLDSTDWVITTPSGLFDASPGAMRLMHYVVPYEGDREIIELEQLKERYYEPGLLPKLMGYSDEAIRSVEGFDSVSLYTAVSLQLDSQAHQLLITLTPRNGGMGKVSVFINGKEIIENANPFQGAARQTKTLLPPINLTNYSRYFLQDSLNTISVRAYNEAGWLKSPAHSVAYRPRFALSKGTGNNNAPSPAFQAIRDPALYAILIGTANYAGTKLDLKYPDKDAEAMASAIQQAGSQLFGADSVVIRLFITDTTGLAMHPSKDNIRKAFEAVKARAKAEDILLVYLSGHGVTYGDAERAQFYYLTQDISSEDLSDEGVRSTRAISSGELTKWINDIPAQKQVMILDACNSGKLVELLESGTKSLNSTQVRALDRMKDRTGMFVLAGSASDKVSYEASQYGQGLLTYSILQAMSGFKLRNGKYVDVSLLFEYARDEVPKMAESIGGIQTPTMLTPGSGSIDIGIVNEQVHIPLSPKKPVFIRNNFMDETLLSDHLGLTGLLEAQFQDISAKGATAELIYVDIPKFPNAYTIRGLYRVEGEQVVGRARLFQGEKGLEEFPIKGNIGRPDELVGKIMQEAIRILQKK